MLQRRGVTGTAWKVLGLVGLAVESCKYLSGKVTVSVKHGRICQCFVSAVFIYQGELYAA